MVLMAMRCAQNYILGGKRRLRYQLCACLKKIRMLGVFAYLILNENLHFAKGSVGEVT